MLRKPTQTRKMTLKQEAAMVLPPESDAPAGAERYVQVLVPESPQVFLWLDDPTPAGLGPNRTYDRPVFPPGQRVKFRMRAEQRLFGASQSGIAQGAIVVEYV